MKFFAFATIAATVMGTFSASYSEKEEAFEMWTAQMEAGEISPEVYMVLAQALDGDMPDEFYQDDEEADFAECDCDAEPDEDEIKAVKRGLKHTTTKKGVGNTGGDGRERPQPYVPFGGRRVM